METHLIVSVTPLTHTVANGAWLMPGDGTEGGYDTAVAKRTLLGLLSERFPVEERCTHAVWAIQWCAVAVRNPLGFLTWDLERRAGRQCRTTLAECRFDRV
jgi:hypothetical protein